MYPKLYQSSSAHPRLTGAANQAGKSPEDQEMLSMPLSLQESGNPKREIPAGMATRGRNRHARAWRTIDDVAIDFDPLGWRSLLSLKGKPGSRDLLFGVGFSTLFSLGIVQFLPGTSAGMVFVAIAAHCCLIIVLKGLI